MAARAAKRWWKTNIDSLDVWFFFFAMVRYAAFIAWADVIVRAVRREEAKENWKTFVSSAALITFSSLTSASEARELSALRGTAVEMRGLVDDDATQAELRDQRAAERDRQAAKQQADMLLLNKRMVVFAALTLAVALVALVVTLAQ
ncbi:MAG: hypothetical protein ACLQBY_13560 [Solirubrobacteraceae bacterium]